MNELLQQKERELQDLLHRIRGSGSFESADLSRQALQLVQEIKRLEREAQTQELAAHGAGAAHAH